MDTSQHSSFSHVCSTGPLHQLHICCCRRRKSTTGKGKKGAGKRSEKIYSLLLEHWSSITPVSRVESGRRGETSQCTAKGKGLGKKVSTVIYATVASQMPWYYHKPAPNRFNCCSLVCNPCSLSTTSNTNDLCSFFSWSELHPFWRWHIFQLNQKNYNLKEIWNIFSAKNTYTTIC